MANLHFLPDDVKVEAEPGQSLLDASLAAGITHTHVCGGRARCSTCRVTTHSQLPLLRFRHSHSGVQSGPQGDN